MSDLLCFTGLRCLNSVISEADRKARGGSAGTPLPIAHLFPKACSLGFSSSSFVFPRCKLFRSRRYTCTLAAGVVFF